MSPTWDEAVIRHLDEARRTYAEVGAIQFRKETVTETWRNNRARWSPDGHFDDTNTLGYQTSRNVSNRILATYESGLGDFGLAVVPENGVPVLEVGGLRLRVVKSPIDSGKVPDFYNDFDWSSSAARQGAAQRNSANYLPLNENDWTLTYDSDPRPSDKRRVDRCRDLFLLWAAELDSDETSGWLGIPRMGDSPWLGVIELWQDYSAPSHLDEIPEDDD